MDLTIIRQQITVLMFQNEHIVLESNKIDILIKNTVDVRHTI